MRGSIKLGRIAGIEIGIHYSWIFIFVLVAWSLAQGLFPQQYPGWTPATYWASGLAASALLFVSVLLHEMAHSLVAKSRGLPVRSITLFILGGVSNLEEEPKEAKVEFVMALAGPLSSVVLSGIFWLISQSIGTQLTPGKAISSYLAFINLILGIFNLLPGFPLDGGRVFRSIVWRATGNLEKATTIAANAGRVFGWGFMAFGVFQVLMGQFFGGLWIAFIGWFLSSAADASRREVTLREHLSGVFVKDIMSPGPQTISPETSVDELVRGIFRQQHKRAVPVARDHQLVGIVTVTDIRELPPEHWSRTSVEKIMKRPPLYSVSPDDDLNTAMKVIAGHDINQVLVMKDGQLVGVLSRAEIVNYLQVSHELGIKRKSAPGSKSGDMLKRDIF